MSLWLRIQSVFTDTTRRVWIWPSLSFLLLIMILVTSYFPVRYNLEAGEVARYDVEAPFTTKVIHREKTEELRQEAAREVPNVLEEDGQVQKRVQEELNSFFELLSSHAQEIGPEGEEEAILDADELLLSSGLSVENMARLTDLPEEELEELQEKSWSLLKKHLEQGVRSTHVEDVKEQIRLEIVAMDVQDERGELLFAIVQNFLQPNLLLNEEATEARRQEAMARVDPVQRTIQQGEVLIRQGQVVQQEHIQLLSDLGILGPMISWSSILGIALIVALIMAGAGLYLYQYHRSLLQDEATIVFLSLLPLLTVLLARLATTLPVMEPAYLIPVAAASILMAVLLNSQVALFLTPFLGILAMFVSGGQIAHFTVMMVGSFSGIYSVSKVSQRTDFVRAGFVVAGFTALAILGLSLTKTVSDTREVLFLMSLGLFNGLLAAILINGLLPLLENYMGLTSSVRLLELSNPNQPLLKKLLMEAPGTYHHSIIVGNLAEAAADRLGADSLLTRVGAYYHDVGKIKRPYFFSENLLGDANPHNKLNNSLSALIIKSHVKDGVELAKKYRIPQPIVDIMQQHHGTTMISYFYQEALQKNGGGEVDRSGFTYDGPKPQTREAALILLADVVEATARSRAENGDNPQRLEGLIHELIREKMEMGQLDECDLTLKDLEPIGDCFSRVLTGIYHRRVEYPDSQEMGEEGCNGVDGFDLQ